ncbi:MAG: AraC family transcriptional regulator [Rhodocyclaceae bacterium]
MPQSREQFLLARRRLQTVMDFMAAHLDDEYLSLDDLASVAHLSRSRFERLYALKVHETPMATLRRLRLQRARDLLITGSTHSVSDLAMQMGYGSIAAFSRAFSRQFGVPPTRASVLVMPDRTPQLDIINIGAVPVICLPYAGRAAEVFQAGDELTWRIARAGAKQWRHWVVHPDGWVNPQRFPDTWVRMLHCVPSAALPTIKGLDTATLPAGSYARFRFTGPHSADIPQLTARVKQDTGREVIAGPMLRHFPTVPPFTPPSERMTWLLLSVAPQDEHCDQVRTVPAP